MTKLTKDENNFSVNQKRVFQPQPIRSTQVTACFEFAYEMVFGAGHHRLNRSGGSLQRKKGELFANTFQGKLAEFVLYDDLQQAGFTDLASPDTSVMGVNEWDDTDLICNTKKINIKSTAHFSNLLLLETKDWNSNGEYIPNNNQAYDFFVLVRIKEDIKRLFKKHKILYSNNVTKEKLKGIIFNQGWLYDYGGVCTHTSIKHIINNGYELPKGATLNRGTTMDADNYYIQTGSLKQIDFLIDELDSV